jgi:hypothetical protein
MTAIYNFQKTHWITSLLSETCANYFPKSSAYVLENYQYLMHLFSTIT